ncbi:ABC transporter ATP-binding protein [Fulvivirga sp. M361]|uniref:ABC transporter ATP-binding protein n=1 Tax=Fulvivirga sp. M361 TaxID=2594266 RepID=UPI00117A60E4|nr:ABC transporter ATP-binding protein [Fulvivirga sp. M361]TRX59179.1 ABC transporter ATP-binding protein [Fulvivirga sp. M361]
MLEAINLSKSYGGHQALIDLNLSVAPGEVFCLLGANGAGKTTTINLFMGFIQPGAGYVMVNNLDITGQSGETRKHLAYIPENLNLYGNLTGLENLQFFAGLGGDKPDKSSAEQLLRSVGLQSDAVQKRVSQYSKGMRQKVGIAIAKAKQADNLLLDEPTSGLDPQASNDFARLLQDMRQNNVAILMATHDLFRAKDSGTHIGIMKAGKLIHSLKSNEITLTELEHLYLETMKSEGHVEVSH